MLGRIPSVHPTGAKAPRIRVRSEGNGSEAALPSIQPAIEVDGSKAKKSPAEQLEQLRRARAESQVALREAQQRKLASYGLLTSSTIDLRMYESLEKTRDQLSNRLSDSQRTVGVLERTLETRDEDLTKLHGHLSYIKMEAEAYVRGLAGACTSLRPALAGNNEALEKLNQLQKDMDRLVAGLREREKEADAMRVREVPIVWYGNAQEVRVMGTFDEWTTGVELSPSSLPDQVFTKFEGSLKLRPGKHYIKFLIDGTDWRLASDWQTENNSLGETNNVIVIE